MPLPDDHLQYPRRRYGMDQDWYAWSMLPKRAPVTWPGGARIALWIVPALEFFPLNPPAAPFKAPGSMVTPYPDLRHFTLRDYGNRVGIFRVMRALDGLGLRASVTMNAAVAERAPFLVEEVNRRGWEIIANGIDMGHLHHAGLEVAAERELIQRSLETLRGISGQPVTGWLSPARSESMNTLDLLAEAGLDYVCDWVNDELPYKISTKSRPLYAMPHSHEIDDQTIIFQYKRSADEFADQVMDQFDVLYSESADQGGRIMAITLHPWICGQPHRIAALERALRHISTHPHVWSATGREILNAFRAQQTDNAGGAPQPDPSSS